MNLLGFLSKKKAKPQAAYEVARGKYKKDNRSADSVNAFDGATLRGQARNLVQNHDIASGSLDIVVNNVVGKQGVIIEPMPLDKKGNVHQETAQQIRKLWHHFLRFSATGGEQFSQTQRLVCASWLRDGEVFVQHLTGIKSGLPQKVPYIQELIEADHCPYATRDGYIQGIKRNDFGYPVSYLFSRDRDSSIYGGDTIEIDANRIMHVKHVKRARQSRGITVFQNVIARLNDLKSYEDSERFAARVTAMLAAVIERDVDAPDENEVTSPDDRRLSNGALWHLARGEKLNLVSPNRPNPNLIEFVKAQLKAVSAGVGVGYSTLSRDYSGTYSAQRQELIETWVGYAVLQNEFGCMYLQPTYMKFIETCIANGLLKLSPDLDIDFIDNATYTYPVMPWIDPVKEVTADKMAVNAGFKSRAEVIRGRGGDPGEVTSEIDQEAGWRQKHAALSGKKQNQ